MQQKMLLLRRAYHARRSHLIHPQAYQAITDAAKERKCDLIVMPSHRRRGIAAIVLGSETNKVLTHSAIPVLVVRPPHPEGDIGTFLIGREVGFRELSGARVLDLPRKDLRFLWNRLTLSRVGRPLSI